MAGLIGSAIAPSYCRPHYPPVMLWQRTRRLVFIRQNPLCRHYDAVILFLRPSDILGIRYSNVYDELRSQKEFDFLFAN